MFLSNSVLASGLDLPSGSTGSEGIRLDRVERDRIIIQAVLPFQNALYELFPRWIYKLYSMPHRYVYQYIPMGEYTYISITSCMSG